MADLVVKKMRNDAKADAFKKMIDLVKALPRDEQVHVIRATATFFEVTMPDDAASVAFWSRR